MRLVRLRLTLAAFAAVSGIAGAGVASAATADQLRALDIEQVRAEIVAATTDGTSLPVLDRYSVAGVSGHSTGDGPADDAECERWAGLIDALNVMLVDEENGAYAAYLEWEIVRARSDGESRGCWFMD